MNERARRWCVRLTEFVCTAAQEIVTQGEQALLRAVDAAEKKPIKATVVTPSRS